VQCKQTAQHIVSTGIFQPNLGWPSAALDFLLPLFQKRTFQDNCSYTPDAIPAIHPTSSVRALKETQNTDRVQLHYVNKTSNFNGKLLNLQIIFCNILTNIR